MREHTLRELGELGVLRGERRLDLPLGVTGSMWHFIALINTKQVLRGERRLDLQHLASVPHHSDKINTMQVVRGEKFMQRGREKLRRELI